MKRILPGELLTSAQGILVYADVDGGTLHGAMGFPGDAIMLCIMNSAFKRRHLVLCCGMVAWVDATRCGVL